MCLSLTQYLSVADNAGDAVFLYVPASSKGNNKETKQAQ
jgi:hypothetical protein